MAEESKRSGGGGGLGSESSSSSLPTARREEEDEGLLDDSRRIADAALEPPAAGGKGRAGVEAKPWARMEVAGVSLGEGPGSWRQWLDEVGAQATALLDAASERFAERRRLVLSLAGVLLVLGVALNLLNREGEDPSAFLRPGSQSSHLPTHFRRLIQAKRLAALRLKQEGEHGLFARHKQQRPTGGPTAAGGEGSASMYLPPLQPIATTFDIVRDRRVDFIVSLVKPEAAAVKPQALLPPSPASRTQEGDGLSKAAVTGASGADPFAEGVRDERLVVTDVGPEHVLMLNKYPSMTDHLLIVTKDFQPQDGLLTGSDLHALWRLVKEVPAVGFFNSGPEAGASQPHRHLQAVPLDVLLAYNPLASHAVPLNTLVDDVLGSAPRGSSFRLPALPFPHRVFLLPADPTPHELEGLYHRLLKRIGYRPPPTAAAGAGIGGGASAGGTAREDEEDGSGPALSYSPITIGGLGSGLGEVSSSSSSSSSLPSVPAYNLVMTHRWLLAVPRKQREYLGVDVNGMGFFGALLARDQATLDVIKRVSPFAILSGVVPSTV